MSGCARALGPPPCNSQHWMASARAVVTHVDVEEGEGRCCEEEDEGDEVWTLAHRVLDAWADTLALTVTVSAARCAAAISHGGE